MWFGVGKRRREMGERNEGEGLVRGLRGRETQKRDWRYREAGKGRREQWWE